jgi:chromosome partitioning protein
MRIVLTNQKGGVGKTTLAFHLASLFASDGRSVLAVDLDPQGNLTSCFLRSGVQHANHAAVLFQGGFPQPLRVADHVDLVGADSELGRYEDHSATDGLYAVRTWLERDNAHDCVILDTPPAMGLFTRSALLAADFALIPADVSWFALQGLADLVASIDKLRTTYNARVSVLGIVLNNIQERQSFAQETWAELDDLYGRLLFKTTIPESVRVRESVSQGIPVTRLDSRGKAAAAYRRLYKEMTERLEQTAAT